MENYSEVLKEAIMSWQHIFVCGDDKERTKYLVELANSYKFDSSKQTPLEIYTKHSGLEDCKNDFCEKPMVDILQRDYMEWVLYSLVLEKLMFYLPLEETETLERNLPFLLDAEIHTLEQARKALQDCQNISKEIYSYYIEKKFYKSKII